MANDVYQLVIVGGCAGEFWETVQHFEGSATSGSDPVGAADNLITGFRAAPEATLADIMAADTSIYGYKAKRINNGGGPVVMVPITPVVGTVAGTSATSGTAQVIVSRFPHAGKFKTGRWFIPGVPEANLTGNHLTPTQIGNIGAFINDVTTFSSGGFGFTYGTWSRKFTAFFAPTYIAPSAKIGIQRRRLLPVL